MRSALFLPAALLLLGCQHQPDPQTTARLTQLQSQVKTQQDTLREMRRKLNFTQRQLEEAALAANALALAGLAPTNARARPAGIPAGTLYGKPTIVALPDAEMAEVLSLADSTSSGSGEEYSVKAYRVCNGPADLTLDFCNCSHYVYLALDTGGIPYKYKLYRVGPFYEAQFAGWSEGEGDDAGQPILRVRHDIKGRKKVDSFRIGWQGVSRL